MFAMPCHYYHDGVFTPFIVDAARRRSPLSPPLIFAAHFRHGAVIAAKSDDG